MRIRRRPPFQSSTPLDPDPFLQQTEEGEGTRKEARSRTIRRGLLHPEPNDTRQVLNEEKIQEQTLDPKVISDKSGRSPGAADAAAVLLKEEHDSNGGYSDDFNLATEVEGKGKKKKKKKRKQIAPVLMEGSRCSRVNGRGWRCCQQTLVGYSLCEHHLGKGRLRRGGSTSRSSTSTTRNPKKETRDQLLLGADDARREGGKKAIGTVTKARSIGSLLDETDHAAAAIISSLALAGSACTGQ